MSSANSTAWFIFDNGSIRAESTRSLRGVATALSRRTGLTIQAVSLLHSSNVPAEELGGEAARLLEPALVEHFEAHADGEAVLLPLFFGPSAALTDYVPARLARLRERFPDAKLRFAPWLVAAGDEGDLRLANVLADQVRAAMTVRGWVRPHVVLVDHGSPQRGVADVRDQLGRQVRQCLKGEIDAFSVASMERREGAEFAFNEPLLETVLRRAPFDSGRVVVALQFLSPGRHAGPGGDIAGICAQAEAERPGLSTQMTAPIAGDPRLVELLAERLTQAKDV